MQRAILVLLEPKRKKKKRYKADLGSATLEPRAGQQGGSAVFAVGMLFEIH